MLIFNFIQVKYSDRPVDRKSDRLTCQTVAELIGPLYLMAQEQEDDRL